MASSVERSHEDVSEYLLFPQVPEGMKPSKVEKYLEEQVDTYLAHVSTYVVDYIWQNEPFNLRVVPPTGASAAHIAGTTSYGDNVDDEWFIVFLLQQLTKNFPGLLAKISDSDGEFLLIEAADNLPKWLNPETADNRIFLYSGKLHIIPKKQTPGTPTLLEAAACIRSNPQATLASEKIQADIRRRLADYPEKKYSSLHRAHCYVPAGLAAVLDHSPSLVAPIVQAFYHRDPVDLRACITFNHFRPGTRILREVRLTKCLYAQLMKQKFQPDKRSGYSMPAPSNPKFKSQDLGMKLAHGAEILCSRCGPLPEDIQDVQDMSKKDVRWARFVESLNENGYFRGELEGSKLYTKLLDEARVCFYNTTRTSSSKSAASPGQTVLQLLKSIRYDLEEMRKEEKHLRPEDDDEWLNLSPEQLDDMLSKISGKTTSPPDSFNLEKMAGSMNSFIDKVSSHEGAEFPKQEESDIQFDPNSFVQTMQKMFDFDDDDGNSSSDMDEYGSDDDLADSLSPSSPKKSQRGKPGQVSRPQGGKGPSLKDYMEMMDKELATTTIAESFKTSTIKEEETPKPQPPPRKKKQERLAKGTANGTTASPGKSQPVQLPQKSKASKSKKKKGSKSMKDDIDDLEEDFEPVNVDLNLVQNLLESYRSQDGMAGPASNIMGSMGMKIPQDSDKQ